MANNEAYEKALETARAELLRANHISETAAAAGIQKIYSNKSEWLTKLIYLAEKGLEHQKQRPRIVYRCDKLKCKNCNETDCKHTADIKHAVNFKNKDGVFVEK